MKCHKCGGDTTVFNTVYKDNGLKVIRERRCLGCGAKFKTAEVRTSENFRGRKDQWRDAKVKERIESFNAGLVAHAYSMTDKQLREELRGVGRFLSHAGRDLLVAEWLEKVGVVASG